MTGIAKFSALAFATIGLVTSAHAEQASFAYHPAELRDQSGARALLARLRIVAKAECRGELLVVTKGEKQCRKDVEAEWVQQIGSPLLSRLSRGNGSQVARAD